MSIDCSAIAPPPGCSCAHITREECEGWIAGLQDRFGDPPAGSYFWARKEQSTGSFSVSLCYDDSNPVHRIYAGIIGDTT